jgi:hypothetical protein
MKQYKLNEIINQYNQNIVYLSNQIGKNELEKMENLITQSFKLQYTKHTLLDKNNQNITCLVYMNKSDDNGDDYIIDIFNSNGDKINTDHIDGTDIRYVKECLIDLGYL